MPLRSTAKVSAQKIDAEGDEETEGTVKDDKRIIIKLHTSAERISDLPDNHMELKDLWFADNEIPFNILSRLPTQDLLGLKCISKDWQRLISEPSFIKQKMKMKKEPVFGFFFQERFHWCDEDISSISFIKNPKNDAPGGTDIQRAVFDFLPDNTVLLAATNGLVCCRSRLPCLEPIIYVSNPSNKEWVTVQFPEADKLTNIGLAFDPLENSFDKTTNFKLVKVVQIMKDSDEDTDTDDDMAFSNSTISFEVYSSKTRTWIKSKETFIFEYGLYRNKSVCVRGKLLFWLTKGDKILMYDTENDVVRFISYAVPLMGPGSFMCIGESEEKLHHVLVSKEGIQVWALEERVEFDWELKYFVDFIEIETENYEFFCNVKKRVASHMCMCSNRWMDPLAYKDGILLMRVSRKIYKYNFDTREVKELCKISDLGPNSMLSPIVIPYSMSLVPFVWP